MIPVVLAQRDGQLEPLMFDASLLAVGRRALVALARSPRCRWACSRRPRPSRRALIQDPAELAVGIWILGVTFPWMIGRAVARQLQLAAQLDAARRELARQAVLTERRRIARDVHDLVGHGLAAVMLQVTSARHVLRRDPAAAEEALRSAEEVGRRSMQRAAQHGRAAAQRRGARASRRRCRRRVRSPRSSTRRAPAGSRSSCDVDGDLARIAPSVGVAATGSPRRRWPTRPGTRRTRARSSGSS